MGENSAITAIVSHDAGGAEIISSWVKNNEGNYFFVLEGPAISIFKNKLGILKNIGLHEAIQRCDLILCGTSWKSDLEKKAILQSKKVGKKIVAFLDHWVNYEDRFTLNGIKIFPDEIWVSDKEALKIAKKTFSEIPVLLIPNYYFLDITTQLKLIKTRKNTHKGVSILYVCEPIMEHALLRYGDENYWGYTEISVLNYFLKNIVILFEHIAYIKIRPHPSEEIKKYEWTKSVSPLISEISNSKLLVQDIMDVDLVVGCSSMAMIVALLANKRVISSIPFKGNFFKLPFEKIEYLQDLLLLDENK